MTQPRQGRLEWITIGGNNAEKIGANTHALVYTAPDGQRHGLLIDAGSYFADPEQSGFSLLCADPRVFLDDPSLKLEGHVFTHAHEDHIGGETRWVDLGYDLPTTYATPLTKSLIIKNLISDRVEQSKWPQFKDMQQGKTLRLGPFEIEPVPVSHSLSQSSLLRIKTPAGTIVHSGDLKTDQTVLLGPATDFDTLQRIGDEGVDALLMESTNTLSQSPSIPEAEVRETLAGIVAKAKGKRVVVGNISRNTERLASLAEAAARDGRVLVMRGRAMETVADALRRSDIDLGAAIGRKVEILSAKQADKRGIPPGKRVEVATGTQGGDMGALPQAARGEHRHLHIGKNDVVVIAQGAIPGNEAPYAEMVDGLRARGAEVITPKEALVHSSGHFKMDEWAALVGPLQPKAVIPIHGGPEQIDAHLKVIEEAGLTGFRAQNMDVVEIGAGGPKKTGQLDQGLIGFPPQGQFGYGAPVYDVRETKAKPHRKAAPRKAPAPAGA